jgi:glutathione S-transferase
MPSKPRLYTFAVSHFSEKIRWTLDLIGMDYEEVVWTPVHHIARALLKARRATTVPILEVDGQVIQDSTRILMWLEQHRPPFPLLPSEHDERQAVLEIEQRFDIVGKHVIRYVYASALSQPDAIIELWTLQANPFERLSLSWAFPAVEGLLRRQYKLAPAEVARSRGVLDENLGWLTARVSGGRPFLHGEQLSVADVTAAALLAPLACPAEHPVYSQPRYREAMAPVLAALGESPALAWVRELYRSRRRARIG